MAKKRRNNKPQDVGVRRSAQLLDVGALAAGLAEPDRHRGPGGICGSAGADFFERGRPESCLTSQYDKYWLGDLLANRSARY